MESVPLFPKQASNFAVEVDGLYALLLGLTIFFSLLVFGLVIFFAAKYRVGSKADRRHAPHHNLKLELGWTIIPALMSLPVFLWAAKIYVDMYTPLKSKNALDIFVIGKQWMWHLQHPTGQRENNELHIPINKPIRLTLISQDVIHSFFIPDFRIKKDVLPGKYATFWFTATKPGKYHLFCAEFCGTKHAEMVGWVYAMQPEDYEKWLRNNKWGTDPMKPMTLEAQGEALLTKFGCQSCHNPIDRKGPPLQGLFGKEVELSDGRTVLADEAYIRKSIYEPETMKVKGYEPLMPSFKGVVDEMQVLQLIAYMKSMPSKPKTEEATTEGKK